MARKGITKDTDLIAKTAQIAQRMNKGKAAKALADFIRHYYAHVPPVDLAGRSPEDLIAIAKGHRALADKRSKRGPAIRVFNPSEAKDGWTSPYTIVEIVTTDMPFLVDSVTAELNRQGLTVHLSVHPIFHTRRGASGRLAHAGAPDSTDVTAKPESFMYMEVTEIQTPRLAVVEAGIATVLSDVAAAVADWRPMRIQLSTQIEDMAVLPRAISADIASEARAFLQWAHDDHYTFLGCRDYSVKMVGKGRARAARVQPAKTKGLGVLRDAQRAVLQDVDSPKVLSADLNAFIARPDLLLISKSANTATVHRSVHMDIIAVKRFDGAGRVEGIRLFAGLFTSVAYNRSPSDIPLLRSKLKTTALRAGFAAGSHNGKALMNILETFPRDELFQISDDDLHATSLGILHLQERQRTALFVRKDEFGRFVSCLTFVPRDRYTTDLRLSFQQILETAFNGTVVGHYTQVGDSPLARVHLMVEVRGDVSHVDRSAVEAELAEAARTWSDRLEDALVSAHGEQDGLALFERYRMAFPVGYRDRFQATDALADVQKIEEVYATGEIGMTLYRADDMSKSSLRFKVYHPNSPIPLSQILPMLEDMGLSVIDEMPYHARPHVDDEMQMVMIHDFGLTTRSGDAVDIDSVRATFSEAFRRVWRGEMECDGFNALVLGGGLAWREVVVLRAIAKYLRQAGIAFSQDYMERTLFNNPKLAAKLVALFNARFDPVVKNRDQVAKRLRTSIATGLEAVASADEDRILRRYLNLIDCMLRTNFFQPMEDGAPKPYVSFKLSSRDIEELPLPRPLREIFVYSPRIEGVHLRFGLVARGGLRWSDRPEDFRTEILGLVKAQQVKNAVIVPVGSKGGFVCKQLPTSGDRDAWLAEGIACYKTFISGLLDITDNLVANLVVPPKDVVRHDDDDPYLVVAADKGTATFSDIANGVAADYGFWLDDAFASGGSVGYDHKKMGITAKGAWESVKRHFRELGVNTQAEPFTAIGVGDMSGDVFGNGMLLSHQTKLIAAFNHLHIFIDPDPDPASSFKERKRLFNLPRSGWTDYDTLIMSKGGAIYERAAKAITVTPQIQKRFGLAKNKVTPNQLLQAILTAEVDLLWFGGIGTYIKSKIESHSDAGDRANDAIRVNGEDLNCRVIGEGANLGATQNGRIEFALAGGRINTDFIDNSAGVDCSDHEVNIKILIQQVMAKSPKSLTAKARVKLLEKMTDEVGELVLRDNYLQTQAMTLIEADGGSDLDDQIRLMRTLEREGRLDRNVEFLPDDETLAERVLRKQCLTRPEIAVVMSYTKLWIYDELLQSNLPDDPYLANDMVTYFPVPLQKAYRPLIGAHRLKREIVATRVTNSLINRTGATFAAQMMEKTGMLPSDIARAFMIVRSVFDLPSLWSAIEALDNKVSAQRQITMMQAINQLVERAVLWFLRHGEHPMDIGNHISFYRDGIASLTDDPEAALPAHYIREMNARADEAAGEGVPKELAIRVAGLVNLASACDIVDLARRTNTPAAAVGKLYYTVGSRFRLGRLRAAAERLGGDTHWQRLAVAAVIEELYAHELALTAQVLDTAGSRISDPEAALAYWAEKNSVALDRTESLLSELWDGEITDLSMIAVASRQLSALVQANPQG